jgi:sugar transferase (PEP-CTERM/EpsH1 system associated)
MDDRPLVLHVVYRFDVGGLENGIVNLLNHMPRGRFRHAVLALTEVTDFRQRVVRDDVEFIAMGKPPGHAVRLYPRLYRLMRRMRPAIVHTRNLAALEVAVPAWAAGVSVRIHGEHGRDVSDLDGARRGYQWMRRLYRPFVSHYVALSRELASYLGEKIGVPPSRVTQVYNGVDVQRFRPADGGKPVIAGCPFSPEAHWLVGTVGRMQPVKAQTLLAHAFVRALAIAPQLAATMRLVLVGDGPLREACRRILDDAGCGALAWLPGERGDVADIMRGLDGFVLPSLAEGVSNTILEAMATGLPVVATAVGANADLVVHGDTGWIVPPADEEAMAQALVEMARDPQRARALGARGRAVAERRFGIQAMVSAYQAVYESQLLGVGAARVPAAPRTERPEA